MTERRVRTDAERAAREARNMRLVARVAFPAAGVGMAILIGFGSHQTSAWISMISLGVAGVFAEKSAHMFGRAAVAYERIELDDGRPPSTGT